MSDDGSRQFLDTNILVYAYDATAGNKRQKANQLVSELWQNENGFLSVQVLQEFYVTVTNKIPRPITAESAAQIISDLGMWDVHSPKAEDILTAIRLQTHYQISFWDAMIITSALKLDCQVLWSEDLNDGQAYGGIEVRNPFSELDV